MGPAPIVAGDFVMGHSDEGDSVLDSLGPGPNTRQTRKFVRYYIRLRALLYQVSCATIRAVSSFLGVLCQKKLGSP